MRRKEKLEENQRAREEVGGRCIRQRRAQKEREKKENSEKSRRNSVKVEGGERKRGEKGADWSKRESIRKKMKRAHEGKQKDHRRQD